MIARQKLIIRVSTSENKATRRESIMLTLMASTLALGLQLAATPPLVVAKELWGTRSFIKERFFQEGLSPDEAVARIKQTTEGLHAMRPMLETMSWRYVIFYIRLKSAYLSSDLNNALRTLPESPRRTSYVKIANELVDNMAEVYICMCTSLSTLHFFSFPLHLFFFASSAYWSYFLMTPTSWPASISQTSILLNIYQTFSRKLTPMTQPNTYNV